MAFADRIAHLRAPRRRRAVRALLRRASRHARACARTIASARASIGSNSIPNYHALMQAAIEHGVAGLSWREPAPGAHVARAALSYLHHQVEPGTSCPLTMTHAAVPALRRAPALAEWADEGRRAALRPARYADRRQARRHARHGHDGEAGRLRRARQHHARRTAGGRRRVRAHRPQMVLLRADVRWVPRARAGAGRADVLPVAATPARMARRTPSRCCA